MNVLFVQIHPRHYRREVDRAPRASLPPYAGIQAPEPGWSSDLMAELVRRGHAAVLAQLDSRGFMDARFDGRAFVDEQREDGVRAVVTSSVSALRSCLPAADAIVLRKDHVIYRRLFQRHDLRNRPVVVILTSVAKTKPRFRPRTDRFATLVNDACELSALDAVGIPADVFLKPASGPFLAPIEPVEKKYDMIQVLNRTGLPRKRFGLFLESLPILERVSGRPLSIAIAGDSIEHARQIAHLNERLRDVTIDRLGVLGALNVRRAFLSSKLSVVTAKKDANPRVIAESLASDVPVALAADITGGRFQITSETGELFEPTPEGLAATVSGMLAGLARYRPRAHCITAEQCADQIERVIAR